jgi:Rrf2 family nitric oxide-sensitive transcriptional repressor
MGLRLTVHADLAFRTLIFLAAAGQEGAAIPQISTAYSVSEHHLRKVAARLIEIGFVKATRGRGGGLRLAAPPSEISIGGAMRRLESDFSIVECLGVAPDRCVIAGCCGLQTIFAEALDAWFKVLDRYTLADAIGGSKSNELFHRLGLEAETSRLAP